MQGVDIKYLGRDLPHGGMDQRKIQVLAREVFPKLKWGTPVPLHHHLLMGLSEPAKANDKLDQVVASKMSKSKPWTAIFIHDSEKEIQAKLEKAWCPPTAEMNPVLELIKYIIFHENKKFELERSAKFGGDMEFSSYTELEKEYVAGKIHAQYLKSNVAREINKLITPVRKHFEKPANKKLLQVYDKAEITR